MENNLVIGNTSQLSHYFPDSFKKISSRNLDWSILNESWDSVYITFAKQNVFENHNEDFVHLNTYFTLEIVEKLLDISKKIVVYTSCEMYNNVYGPVTINTRPSFIPKDNNNYTNYILSKFLLSEIIRTNRKKDRRWDKVIIINPFNFESVYKNQYFLFGKIVKSIVNKEIIQISNIDFYKDLSHAKRIVECSLNAQEDCVVGSGKLVNVRETVAKLYGYFDMDYYSFVRESTKSNRKYNFYYSDSDSGYDFLKDMIDDLELHTSSLKS